MRNNYTFVHRLRTSLRKTSYHFFVIHASQHIILVLLFITVFTPKSFTKRMRCLPKPKNWKYTQEKLLYFWGGDEDEPLVTSINQEKQELNCNDLRYQSITYWKENVASPPVIVKWYKNGQPLKEDSSKFKVFGCNIDPYYIGGRLYLYEPQLSDTGLYQCKVFRRDNKSFILEKNIPFFVLDEKSNSMPISLLNSKESSKDKKTSGEMKLNCAYESRGINATLTWYWKAKKQKEKDTVLEVCYPGLYRCEVKNYLGGFNKTFKVLQNGDTEALDLHCRSHLAALLISGSLVIALITLLVIIVYHSLKKTFLKDLFPEKSLLKVHRHWVGYGMHTDIIQADKKASKLTEQVTISEPGLSDEKQAYCQQVWSITGQLEKNAALSKNDLDLVKQKEISRERVVCVDKNGKAIELGSGFFGNVYKGFLVNSDGTKTPAAVKMLKNISCEVDLNHFMEEAATLIKSSGHQNVISLIGTCIFDALNSQKTPETSQKVPMLIMELADGGNLHSYLVKCRDYNARPCTSTEEVYSSAVNFNDLVSICYQVALGMEHLTNKKILHRDLAARNILLTKEKVVKIGDFGLSKHLLLKDYYRICSRWEKPVKWTSPEALMFDKYTTWSDIWSFGVLMWEIFSLGAEPYEKMNPNNLYSHLQSGKRLPHPGLATNYLYKCMMSCWEWAPHHRKPFSLIIKELELLLNKPQANRSEQFSILDSNYFHNRQKKQLQPFEETNSPPLQLVNEGSLSSETSSTDQGAGTSKSSANSNTKLPDNQYSLWQTDAHYDNSSLTNVVEYPSLSSNESLHNVSDSGETPYIAQIPNKPAFVFKKQNQPSLRDGPRVSRIQVLPNCLMFENQSYQSRKTRVTSLESPDGDSELSSPTENDFDSLETEDNELFYNDDAYFEVTI